MGLPQDRPAPHVSAIPRQNAFEHPTLQSRFHGSVWNVSATGVLTASQIAGAARTAQPRPSVLYYRRPLWDIVMIVFSAGGLALSATTLVPSAFADEAAGASPAPGALCSVW
jgi:hypothetical protein